MKISKSIKTLDPLSELPDSIVFSIFRLMTMRDVVATTVLSKRWRNLWTSTPYLNFDDPRSRDATFITRTLMLWRGPQVLELKIVGGYRLEEYLFSEIDSWMSFAKDNRVQELVVCLENSENKQYPVPQYLFSCPSLKVLTLGGCKLDVQKNVRWNQLKSLTIHTEEGLSEIDINHVLCGSPQLEVLVMNFVETDEDLTILSTSLKMLSIDKCIGDEEKEPQMNTQLILWTPNLETFEISNVPYVYCSLYNVSSLTDISLQFDHSGFEFFYDYFPIETLEQIIPAIQHVENVTLSDWCIQTLGILNKEHPVPRLWDVKFLKLNYQFLDLEPIASVLEMCPKVEKLELDDACEYLYHEVKSNFSFQPSLPNLRSVVLTWGQCNNLVFSLVEILLKHASSLEEMVFRVKGFSEDKACSESLILASEKIESMQISSPTAKLIFFFSVYHVLSWKFNCISLLPAEIISVRMIVEVYEFLI